MMADAIFLSQWTDNLIDRYPTGYVEVLASVSIQVIYLLLGLFIESTRAPYTSMTSRRMLVHSLLNHVAATLVHIMYVLSMGGKGVLTRTYIQPYALPAWRELVSDLVVGMVLRDIVFYFLHRMSHLPGIYERIHAKHHEIRQPREHHVWTISYMSTIDFLSLYGLPVIIVAKVLEMNILTTMTFALISAAGEQIQLISGGDSHEEHHVNMTVNYGIYGLMDNMLGTSSGLCKPANLYNTRHRFTNTLIVVEIVDKKLE